MFVDYFYLLAELVKTLALLLPLLLTLALVAVAVGELQVLLDQTLAQGEVV
jgi:hypothetical protein